MNKKILISVTLLLTIVMLATPLVVAKPGAEKSNDKFLYFELVPSGEAGALEKMWEAGKTVHARGGLWIPGETVTLTVDTDVFTMETDPISLEYSATFAWDSGPKTTVVRVEDVVTIYNDGVEIGTLVLSIRSKATATGYSGVVVGHGTGYFEGVKISGIDTVVEAPFTLGRVGTVQGWPELPPP